MTEADFNIVLPEVILAVFAMAALLFGAYGGKDKTAPMILWASAGLMALAVNVDDDQLAAAEYAIAHPVSFPVLLDPEKRVAREYRVDNLPMLLLVDRAGVIRHVHRDYRAASGELYREQVKTLLDE